MRVKSYFANTVEAALALATRELGDEAVLLYSRDSSPETRYLGRYEVVLGIETDEPVSKPTALAAVDPINPPPAASATVDPAALDELRMRVDALERRFDEVIRSARAGTREHAGGSVASRRSDVREQLASMLRGSGVGGPMIQSLIDHVDTKLRGQDYDLPQAITVLRSRMIEITRTRTEMGAKQSGPSVVLITVPGARPTAILMQLATHYWKKNGAWPVLATAKDFFEGDIGDELRTYAEAVGASSDLVETPAQLRLLVENTRQDLALVAINDSPHLLKLVAESGVLNGPSPRAELWSGLSVLGGSADLNTAVDRLGPIRAARLLVLDVDGSPCFGPLWTLAAERSIAFSYISAGPRLLEDLIAADANRIVDRILDASTSWGVLKPISPTALPALAGAGR